MVDTAVVWFRRDLRRHDNPTLRAALRDADRIVPIYCFDPAVFGATSRYLDQPKIGAHRARFVRESVCDLRQGMRNRGGDLLVADSAPETAVPAVASRFDADVVHCQRLPGPDEQAKAQRVRDALADRGVELETHWTHTLYHVADLPMTVDAVQDTFTPWKDAVEADAVVREPLDAPESIPTPTLDTPVPSLEELGIDATDAQSDAPSGFAVDGGESAGLDRLRTYVWDRDCLREYRQTRNGLLGMDYSSKLSPWLAQGCLSPRRVHQAVDRYERERVENDSTYWLVFELTWRDFFQFQFAKHGATYFRPGGIRDRDIAWRHDEAAFHRWAAGETGFPFVDAAMRELAATGYQSNRARQNAASFLANTLGMDWRWGAAYYEARLIDYDVCSNWGNWAYIAGVGTDSRDRSFDVCWQAHEYDPDAEYVSHWLPELASLEPRFAHEPWRLPMTQSDSRPDYPAPMVDPESNFDSPLDE